jgi:putative holliday junction resolvase
MSTGGLKGHRTRPLYAIVHKISMKYLGIDYGTKRIGLATSDGGGTMAFPHSTVKAGHGALSAIHGVVVKEGIEKVIIGESRNFKGEANTVMEDIAEFKKDLEELTGLAVEYEAEFLSSAAAARQFEGDFGRGERPDQSKLDASAAAVVLQSYLDRHK